MAVVKNGGYIPDLPDNATRAVIDEVKLKASALKVNTTETAAYVEKEFSKEKSAQNDEKYKQAGAEAEHMRATGDSETNFYADMAIEQSGFTAVKVASTIVQGFSDRKTNPSHSSDADVMTSRANGGQSMEDLTRKMQMAPKYEGIMGTASASVFETAGALFTSASGKSPLSENKGVTTDALGAGAIKLSTTEVKKTLDISFTTANQAKLERAMALDKQNAPGMGMGSGGRAMGMTHDRMAQGPKGPTNLRDSDTDTATGIYG